MKTRSWLGVLFLAVAFAVFPSAGFAQETVRVDAFGQILDSKTAKPVANAAVAVSGLVAEQGTTDGSGRVVLHGLLPGIYRLTVSASGYSTLAADTITILPGQGTAFTAQLQAADSRLIGRVSTSSANAINVSPASVQVVSAQSIIDSGLDGYRRSLEQLPGITVGKPQAVYSGSQYSGTPYGQVVPTIRGTQPYENSVLFDGHRLISVGNPPGFSGTDIQLVDRYSFDHIDIVKGPGATAPTVNNAIGGTFNFIPGIPSGAPHSQFDIGNDGIGSTSIHAGVEGLVLNNRLGFKVDATAVNTELPAFEPRVFFDGGFNGLGILFVNGQNFNNYGTDNGDAGIGVPNDSSAFAVCCANIPAPTGYQHFTTGQLSYKVDDRTTLWGFVSSANEHFIDAPQIQSTVYSGPAITNGSLPAVFYAAGAQQGVENRQYATLAEVKATRRIGSVGVNASYFTDNDHAQVNDWGLLSSGTYAFYGLGAYGSAPELSTFFNGTLENVTVGANVYSNFYREWSSDALVDVIAPIGGLTTHYSFDESKASGILRSQFGYDQLPDGTYTYGPECSLPNNATSEDFKSERVEVDGPIGSRLRGFGSVYFNQYDFNAAQLDPVLKDICGNALQTGLISSGSTFTAPRLAFEYRPNTNLAVRVSAGSSISPLDVSLYEYAPAHFPINSIGYSPYVISGPPVADTLRPETAFGYDVGFDLRTARDTTLSLDGYSSLIHGQYYDFQQLLGNCYALYGAANCLNGDKPVYSSRPANLVSSAERGVEVSYRHEPARGWTYSLSGSMQRAYAISIDPSVYYNAQDPTTPNNAMLLSNINFNGSNAIVAIPYTQGYASVGFNARRSKTRLGVTYYGSNNSYYVPAFSVIDLSERLELSPRLSLLLSGSNLGNMYGQYGNSSRSALQFFPVISGEPTTFKYATPVGPPALSATLTFKP